MKTFTREQFLEQFSSLLPDTISETSIDCLNIEATTLTFIGTIIGRMTDDMQDFYDTESPYLDDMLIDIVAKKYQIEW